MDADPYAAYAFVRQEGPPATDAALLFARAHLVPLLRAGREASVLDLGAGAGTTVLALRALGFERVRGCDGSSSQVQLARTLGVNLELADGLEYLLREPEGSVGAVLALDVLEHLNDTQLSAWLGAACTRLQPGGVLIARVPNGEGLFGGAVRYGDLTHRRAFTADSLRQAFGLAGFGVVTVGPCRPIPHGLPSGLRSAVWLVVETALRLASFAESGRWGSGVFTRNLVAWARRTP